MPPPGAVVGLVERFGLNRAAYHSHAYNEAQVRIEFVNPMFKALGWDVDNTQGYAEPYKDVVYEGRLLVATVSKAPDYSFRIGGTRKFFVEAKKPAVPIKSDPASAFQLRRYAWSAKLLLSVLTNFEEFAVYDCRLEPKPSDKASVARLLYLTSEDYLDHWDKLAEIFSRDSVLKGLFDNFAISSTKKRGTTPVDDAFLQEMQVWRESLAHNIALRNPSLSEDELNYSVQQTIDRLVFLRICEDRTIEPYGQLQSAVSTPGIYRRLIQIFRGADDRYNSGLFHFRREVGRIEGPDELTPNLSIDDKPLKDIVRRLYYPESPYEFSVIPAEILGQVYEQFLGQVIRLTTNHRAIVEDKPEVRRAGGVYYTPTNVVEHIVKGTLGKLLLGKSLGQAANLRVIDPACGSGSFLLVAYQYLLDWHLLRYQDEPAKHKSKLRPIGPGLWALTPAERKRILLNSIYGVDIDAQAVEVTKLSLLLRVLEGENQASLSQQLAMFRERALPDLAKNIKCGNALVESDINRVMTLSSADEQRINAFNWEAEFPEIIRAGGFDVVIGNPPYDVVEKERDKASWPHYLLADYVRQKVEYRNSLGGKLNLFRFFIAKSLQLARRGGRVGMIVPLALLADISTQNTRRHLLQQSRELVTECFPQKDNPRRRIFRKAKLATVVFNCEREDRKPNAEASVRVRVHPWDSFDETTKECLVRLVDIAKVEPVTMPIPLTDERSWQLCLRLHQHPRVSPLESISEYAISRGEVNQKTYEKYISTNAAMARLIKGVEIGQFTLHKKLSQGTREWFDEAAFSALHRPWPIAAYRRIATQRITGVNERLRLVAMVIEPPAFFADSANSIALTGKGTVYGLPYLLGLLNSTLFQWRFKITSTNNNVQTHQLASLPFPKIDFNNTAEQAMHDSLVSHVERALSQHAALLSARTNVEKTSIERGISATEAEINRVVYNLYDLSDEDIALVEEVLAEPAIAV